MIDVEFLRVNLPIKIGKISGEMYNFAEESEPEEIIIYREDEWK